MSATATPSAASKLQPSSASPVRTRRRSTPNVTVETVNPHHRSGRVMFEIRFSSPMSDLDLDRLGSVLDLSTHMYPKMRPDPNSPGVARLDHHSYLERWANPQPAVAERPLGQAANKRLARIRRRLAGLP